jgi:hypothetical protein
MNQETKVISVRIPSEFYLVILEECAEQRCNISEWIILRFHLANRAVEALANQTNGILECGCRCPIAKRIDNSKRIEKSESSNSLK